MLLRVRKFRTQVNLLFYSILQTSSFYKTHSAVAAPLRFTSGIFMHKIMFLIFSLQGFGGKECFTRRKLHGESGRFRPRSATGH